VFIYTSKGIFLSLKKTEGNVLHSNADNDFSVHEEVQNWVIKSVIHSVEDARFKGKNHYGLGEKWQPVYYNLRLKKTEGNVLHSNADNDFSDR
jgi:hypothetical protein